MSPKGLGKPVKIFGMAETEKNNVYGNDNGTKKPRYDSNMRGMSGPRVSRENSIKRSSRRDGSKGGSS